MILSDISHDPTFPGNSWVLTTKPVKPVKPETLGHLSFVPETS